MQRLWKEAHRAWPRLAEWPEWSKRGLSVPLKEFAKFLWSCFAILDFVECDLLSIDQVTRSAMYVLKYYGPKCEFCCQYHLDWGVKFASKIVINIYLITNKNKRKTVFVKTQWRAVKPVKGVNNLFNDSFNWFYVFWLLKSIVISEWSE